MAKKMSRFVGTTILLVLLPALALCSYPWPDNVTQHKGYIEVNKTHGVNLFYWFFESRSNPASDPLVVWLTGGPGCSSELALLTENGPFLINGTADPVYNPYGWNAVSNLLYVDQPAGTGFSYVTNPLGYETNERQIATELWDFIRQFYQLYPKYSTLDLYIFGESYAGHYVPATGQVIVESNSIYAKNLKGIGIGNGWVDPLLQYADYSKYMLMEGLIDQSTADAAADLYTGCKDLIDLGLYGPAFFECQVREFCTWSCGDKSGTKHQCVRYP
ncbi:Serine carboxypeptidase S10 family member 1 [Geodia barretti]|uniref:Carboxypeptidase n=1 Tax=Geodia barretti TaxID=519541 RepID=A0AA35WP73_GEOBA|nr:Serine carboxypeptidase S10 family member 1 [Geodia barretti]